MFDVQCDRLRRRVLVSAGGVTGIDNVEGTIRVFYRCWCGAPGVLTTGRTVGEHSGHLSA